MMIFQGSIKKIEKKIAKARRWLKNQTKVQAKVFVWICLLKVPGRMLSLSVVTAQSMVEIEASRGERVDWMAWPWILQRRLVFYPLEVNASHCPLPAQSGGCMTLPPSFPSTVILSTDLGLGCSGYAVGWWRSCEKPPCAEMDQTSSPGCWRGTVSRRTYVTWADTQKW